jgi:hypothetical protein
MNRIDGDQDGLFHEPPGPEVTEPVRPVADHSDEARLQRRNPFEVPPSPSSDGRE